MRGKEWDKNSRIAANPELMDTKEFGKMMKLIQILEEGRVPAKEAKNWRIQGEKKRITRKDYKRLLNNFEMEGSMAQKMPVELGKRKTISGWPREDEKVNKKKAEADKKGKEEKRGGERRE